MPIRILDGQTVLVDGPRYDLIKVIDACVEVMNVVAEKLAPGKAYLTTVHAEAGRKVPWKEEGENAFRQYWLSSAKVYDAVYEGLVLHAGPCCLKVFPLGMTWCVWHKKTDKLTTPSGKDISELDPEPGIKIWGPATGLESFEIARVGTVIAVSRTVTRHCGPLGLKLVISDPIPNPTDEAQSVQFAMLRMPHERYGEGNGPIRVRCSIEDD